jgi:putative ABC transport system permease protein
MKFLRTALRLSWILGRSGHRSPIRTGLAVIGVALGVTGVATIATMYVSIDRSAESPFRLGATPDFVVAPTSSAGLPAELVDSLDRTPGISTVPVLVSPAHIDGQPGVFVGVGSISTEDLSGVSRACRDALARGSGSGVWLSQGLADAVAVRAGGTVSLYIGATATPRQPVRSIISRDDCGSIGAGSFVLAPMGLAQELSGRSGVDAALVVVRSGGEEAARAEVADQVAEHGRITSLSAVVGQQLEASRLFLSALLLVALLVLLLGAFVVFNAATFALLERRRAIATLRALGVSRSTLALALILRAAVLGLLGGALGVLPAKALAGLGLRHLPTNLGLGGSPAVFAPTGLLLVTVAGGVAAAIVGSVAPIRVALRTDPAKELAGRVSTSSMEARAVPGQRSNLSLVAAVALGVVAFAGLRTSTPLVVQGSLALVVVAVILASWRIVPGLTRAVMVVFRRLRSSSVLVSAGLARAPTRTWATALGIGLAAAVMLSLHGLTNDARRAMARQGQSLRQIDLYVDPAPGFPLPVGFSLEREWAGRLSSVPGVTGVTPGTFGLLHHERTTMLLQGVAGSSHTPMVARASPAARAAVLDGQGVIVSTSLSRLLGVHAGDRLTLPAPRSSWSLPVVDVVDYIGGVDLGVVALSMPIADSILGTDAYNFLEVDVAEDQLLEARRVIQRDLAAAGIPARVETGPAMLDASLESFTSMFNLFAVVQWLVLGMAALSVLDTALVSSFQRTQELSVIRAVGSSSRGVVVSWVLEAAVVGTIGVLFGVAAAFPLQLAADRALSVTTYLPVGFEIAVGGLPLALVVPLLASIGGVAAPAVAISRRPIVEGLADI